MSKKKFNPYGGAIAIVVLCALILIGGIVFHVMSSATGEEGMLYAAIIFYVLAVVLAILTMVQFSRASKVKRNMANPDSIAGRTYGGTKPYARFAVYLNRSGDRARNAAINTLGALGFFFGGIGFFTWGANTQEVFVSEEEFILNDPRKNTGMEDEKFFRIPAEHIADVKFEREKKVVRVIITRTIGDSIAVEVPINNAQSEQYIISAFSVLKPKPKAEEQPFPELEQVAAESVAAEAQAAAETQPTEL